MDGWMEGEFVVEIEKREKKQRRSEIKVRKKKKSISTHIYPINGKLLKNNNKNSLKLKRLEYI
ncbi:hypothetical protein DERF_007334 [Dermatophagoides farinae]|uniref:Uncharacterized protein n=1 Tax=Dermatophagoides farinae TaxID=6954 RepID=A0A922I0V6_DERFA|nr:hypothetical protein DERF_007334 [Dermatophagoides farinae]